MSQSALKSILADVESNGIPESFSRASQHRARKDLCHTDTMYGSLIVEREMELSKGPPLNVGFQNPLAFLHYHCEHSQNFARIVESALHANPSTPLELWGIILYQDGVDFGDGLCKNKSRHSVVFYWSFIEFGMEALCREEVWGTITIMRTWKAKCLPGGVAELTYRVLEQFHNDDADIRISGVAVRFEGNGAYPKIFAKVKLLVSDMPALCEMISAKGHSALKACPLCMNATHHKPPGGAAPMHLFGEYCTPITCTELERFKLYTDATLRQSIANLHALKGNVPESVLEERETNVYGYTYTPWSIILSKRFDIDVASAVMYDWVHTYCADGLADQEFGVFMRIMNRSITKDRMTHTCTYKALGDYLAGWKWPKARGNPMRMFDAAHASRFLATGDFASTASEFLSLAPLMNRFLKRVVTLQVAGTHLEEHVACMTAVLDVLDILQACKIKGAVCPNALQIAIKGHLVLYKRVYGESSMRVKHHYALHLAVIFRRWEFLIGTFTHERKHRAVKRYGRGRTNLSKYETSVLEEVTCHNMWELSDKFWHAFSTAKPTRKQQWWLRDIFAHEPAEAQFTLHTEVSKTHGCINRGDVVVFVHDGKLAVGELQVNVGITVGAESRMVSIVAAWEHDQLNADFIKCQVKNESAQIPTTSLVAALTYHMSNDRSSCVVAIPFDLRHRSACLH